MCIHVDPYKTMEYVNDKECRNDKKVFVFYKKVHVLFKSRTEISIKSPMYDQFWFPGWNCPANSSQLNNLNALRSLIFKERSTAKFAKEGLFAYLDKEHRDVIYLKVHARSKDILGINDHVVFARKFFVTREDINECISSLKSSKLITT